MQRKIIGILGYIGSGKNTAAEYLRNKHQFQSMSFAHSLKLAVSAVFSWDYELLLGESNESRIWRESVDSWWASKLGIPHLTPRWVLQNFGTDALRNHFHTDIWLRSLERQLEMTTKNVVVSDVRFINEIGLIRDLGGQIWRVDRGEQPLWVETAKKALRQKKPDLMTLQYPTIHISEWGWANYKPDLVLKNDSDLSSLYTRIDSSFQK